MKPAGVATMSAAVILPDSIISLALQWRHEYLSHWPRPAGAKLHIGQAIITSPVDGEERRVSALLSDWLDRDAVTFQPDLTAADGELISPAGNYSVIVNRKMVFTRPEREAIQRELLAVILHELTHVVDPTFLADTTAGGQKLGPIDRYNLPSERRAFVAMWIAEMQDQLRISNDFDAESFMWRVAAMSRHFNGLLDYHPELHGEVRDSFTTMAEALRLRK